MGNPRAEGPSQRTGVVSRRSSRSSAGFLVAALVQAVRREGARRAGLRGARAVPDVVVDGGKRDDEAGPLDQPLFALRGVDDCRKFLAFFL